MSHEIPMGIEFSKGILDSQDQKFGPESSEM